MGRGHGASSRATCRDGKIGDLFSKATGQKVQAYLNGDSTRVDVYCDNRMLVSVNVSCDSPLGIIGDVVPRTYKRLM